MSEFRVRLRSVRPKNGGASVTVLHNPMPNYSGDEPDNWRGRLLDHARYIAENHDGAVLDGFVVIGMWNDGRRSCGYRMTPRVSRELFPSYIAEILRTDAITENEAEATFDRRFEWVE